MILPLLILGGIIALGIYLAFAPQAPDLDYKPVDIGGGSIEVSDQESLEVVILNATLVKPGFITIHESMSGAPAKIIGISPLLSEGSHENVAITLTQDMLPGYSYITLLHVDNGDQKYVTEDDLPVMVNGVVVRPDFIAMPSERAIDLPGTDITLPLVEQE